jgi:hypothetical protein
VLTVSSISLSLSQDPTNLEFSYQPVRGVEKRYHERVYSISICFPRGICPRIYIYSSSELGTNRHNSEI